MATLVTLETVKQHLRKGSDTSEDTVIGAYRTAAIAYVEKFTGHILIQREVTDSFAEWGDFLTLRHQPITVGDPTPTLTVTYHDAEGDETEYASRVIRDQRYPWTIHAPYGDEFPVLADNGTITVTYTAGYDAGEVPDELNAAVLLLCGHWYSNRAAVAEPPVQELPLAVVSLCRPFRGAVMA
jgi:uncharacterized phiE125 gp8 family phage protein